MELMRRSAFFAVFALLTAVSPTWVLAKHKAVKVVQAQSTAATPNPAPVPDVPSMTLAEALGIAYETNPVLAAAQAGLRASDELVAQANGAWRPSVSIDGSYGVQKYYFPVQITGGGIISSHPNAPAAVNNSQIVNESITDHPLNGQLTVSQPLFRSGRTVAEISRAKALVRAARAQLTATEQTVLLSAVTAYMNVVRDTAIVKLRENNVEVLRKQRDAVRLEFNAGSLTRTDMAQSDARLAVAQSDLTTARGRLAVSRADFLQSIGRPPETLENKPGLPKVPEDEDTVLSLALKQSPALLQAQANERAANYAVDDAWGAMGPTISLEGQYQYSESALNSVQGFGAGGSTGAVTQHAVVAVAQLHVPIYQAGVEEANIRQTRELHAQSKLDVTATDRQVREAVESVWSAFQSTLGTIESNEATQKADEIAFEGVSKEQQVGGRTVLDVLNAAQELLNAQVALVTSQRDAVVAAYGVLATDGDLTAKSLGLKVKLYDPLEHYNDDAGAWVGFGD